MKKVYWVSRHPPVEAQLRALKELFKGHVQVMIDPQPFENAEEITRRYKSSGADDVVVVAPLSVIQKLIELGVRPLWAEMKQVQNGAYDVYASGRKYRFMRFRRIVGIEIKFED